MTIYAIDPGPTHSGFVAFSLDTNSVIGSEVAIANAVALDWFRKADPQHFIFACESIEALYAHVGKETVRTIRFCGAIEEAVTSRGGSIHMLSPQEVKKHVCGTASAKDPAVRQALIDKLGAPGTKKAPGPTYGVSKHAWRALAVAYAVALLTQREG